MAINHSLFYLQGRKILWKLWVSNKTPWVMHLKCVIHYETVHRGTIQCLGKINFFLLLLLFYAASRENLVYPLLCGAGATSTPYMQKISCTNRDIWNTKMTVSTFFLPFSPFSFLTVTSSVFALSREPISLMMQCNDNEPQLSIRGTCH